MTTMWYRYNYYTHFTNEEIEAQRERLISLVQIKYLRNYFVVDKNFSRLLIVFQVVIDINIC